MIKGIKEIRNVKASDIYMRDPFIYADETTKTYYLYGTSSVCDGAANIDPHFEVYMSKDLENFEGPYVAFEPKKGFWGVKHYWAPEVHKYKDKYYMFASFKGGIGEDRGTGILVSDYPWGPFNTIVNEHLTLKNNECLDGTIYLDNENKPWIVFCHEWTQLYYGKIKALPLEEDLSSVKDYNKLITIVDTEVDEIPWIRHMYDPRVEKRGYLTDAPFMYRLKNGELLMLWSSYAKKGFSKEGVGGYVVALVRSKSGEISGDWVHEKELLLDDNIGHVSLFNNFDGKLILVGHCNDTLHGQERPVFLEVEEVENTIKIKKGVNNV